MLLTLIFVAVMVALLLISAVLWAAFLRLGLRWAKVPGVTLGRVAMATVAVIVAGPVFEVLVRYFLPAMDATMAGSVVVGIVSGVLLPCLIIAQVFSTGFGRALRAWLPTLIPSLVMVCFALLVLRPLVFEAGTMPSNPMAPTLLGPHTRGSCPKCGDMNFGFRIDDRFSPAIALPTICGNFHIVDMAASDGHTYPSDRFLVAKFLKPQRWDIVVFRWPQDESVLFVMRLVGLPGEQIHIEDGAVWVDGQKLAPPTALEGIRYLPLSGRLHATADQPAVLGEAEYFVLGDFSIHAADSRDWREGAPGHNPYAVPESHIVGVVTHIYWPVTRWRILR